VTPYDVTYDATEHTATGTATGVSGEALAGLDLSGTAHTNAGTYVDAWTFTDVTGNYNDDSGSVTDKIAKANATVVVTPYDVTYDATEHTASGTATGVLDEPLAGLDLSGTAHTNAGTYTDTWTFTDVTGNYNDTSGTVVDVIAKATATIEVDGYDVVYDGDPHTATGTVKGVLDEDLAGLDLSATTHTDAGTYDDDWTFTDVTGNYNDDAGSVADRITKATSSTIVTCPASITYDGSAQEPCSATVTGAGGLSESLTVSYSNNTNAGTASASASYPGDANHFGSDDAESFTIDKASSTTTVTCEAGPHVFTGFTITPCSANVTGAGGLDDPVTVSYSNNTNAGTASASASYPGDANHFSSEDTKSFEIDKAASVTTVTCAAGPHVYDGSAQEPCTANVTGVGSLNESLTVTYSNNTVAGTAYASANYAGDANHEPSSDATTFEIDKA
jgi:hypothetical protein